jgi:hypothetical protein
LLHQDAQIVTFLELEMALLCDSAICISFEYTSVDEAFAVCKDVVEVENDTLVIIHLRSLLTHELNIETMKEIQFIRKMESLKLSSYSIATMVPLVLNTECLDKLVVIAEKHQLTKSGSRMMVTFESLPRFPECECFY